MWDLVNQKWAQRLVQDPEPQHKTVAAILTEAALANAQLAVAKVVLKAEFHRGGATVEEPAAKAEQAVERMATQLAFGRVPSQTKATRRRVRPEVKVLYFRSFFDAGGNDGKAIGRAAHRCGSLHPSVAEDKVGRS
jgi:hypothetical protein